jgi:hypothetical protein
VHVRVSVGQADFFLQADNPGGEGLDGGILGGGISMSTQADPNDAKAFVDYALSLSSKIINKIKCL